MGGAGGISDAEANRNGNILQGIVLVGGGVVGVAGKTVGGIVKATGVFAGGGAVAGMWSRNS